MRALRDLFQQLPTSVEAGLTLEGGCSSRQQFGSKPFDTPAREPLWKKFLEKFNEPIIKVLLAAALLSMIVDLFQNAGGNLPLPRRRRGPGLALAASAAASLAKRVTGFPPFFSWPP